MSRDKIRRITLQVVHPSMREGSKPCLDSRKYSGNAYVSKLGHGGEWGRGNDGVACVSSTIIARTSTKSFLWTLASIHPNYTPSFCERVETTA